MRSRTLGRWFTGAVLASCTMAGCHSARPAGSTLPTTSPNSVALPGATDAADAPSAPAVAESSTAELVSYRDPMHGVSFAYPSDWRPEQTGGTLPQPAFSAVAPKPVITQIFDPAHTRYADTVLRGLSFSYTVQPNSTAASCASLPAKAVQASGSGQQVTINGIPFTEARGEDAGMCHQRQATVDSALRGSTCFLFERDLATTCPFVKSSTEPRPLTPEEQKAFGERLDAVMGSVRLQ